MTSLAAVQSDVAAKACIAAKKWCQLIKCEISCGVLCYIEYLKVSILKNIVVLVMILEVQLQIKIN